MDALFRSCPEVDGPFKDGYSIWIVIHTRNAAQVADFVVADAHLSHLGVCRAAIGPCVHR